MAIKDKITITDLQKRILSLKENDILIKSKSDYGFESKKRTYDPDSSPLAWEYYFIAYQDTLAINEEQKIALFAEQFPATKDLDSKNFWSPSPCKGIRRIVGTFEYGKNEMNPSLTLTRCGLLKEKNIGIAGDCSFNFNEAKIIDFWSVIDICENETLKKLMQNLLLLCHSMHHSVYNFSLMPTTGGLNIVKGRGKTDQFDSFISRLNDYYRTAPEKKKEHAILTGVSKKYKDSILALKYFLDHQIGTLENYCQLFYHIDINEKNWKGITNQKDIKDYKSLLKYIELAVKFWEHQANNYKKKKDEQMSNPKGDE